MPTVPNWQQLTPTYWERTPLPIAGLAMYYNPRVMDGVINYRLRADDIDLCAECVGYVALLRAGDINRKVWISALLTAPWKDLFWWPTSLHVTIFQLCWGAGGQSM